MMQIALAGVAAAALLTAQVPASYAADSVSAPSTNVRAVCLRTKDMRLLQLGKE